MEQLRSALRSLTQRICHELEGQIILKSPVWTVVSPPDGAPYVAVDVERPALSNVRFGISIRLLQLPEYGAVAEAAENAPELTEGIIVDPGGVLRPPERTNLTRALTTNFLWRYLQEGSRLDWDETRFGETFKELTAELRRQSVVFHTTLPLSNLRMDIDALDFGDGLKLLPASIEELERWINRDQNLLLPGAGPPQWNTNYVDRPAVLHSRHTVIGRPPSEDLQEALDQLPRIDIGYVITALRLVMNAPISVIFQEQNSEGLMALGGGGTSWSWSPPPIVPVALLDQEKATHVTDVWQRLQESPNIDFLRLPIRRWESSLLKLNLEDKLIDAWIGLEALLLGDHEGELRYRGAMRLGEFLGTSGVDRKAIYKNARISYDWRSVVVHGERSGSRKVKNLAKSQPLREAVQHTTEYLRSALCKVLDCTDQFDPNSLEHNLLGRGD